jgi:hypothetical protein
MSKDINIKRTLLKAVKEIKSDLSELSLKDIIVQFSHDVDEYDSIFNRWYLYGYYVKTIR